MKIKLLMSLRNDVDDYQQRVWEILQSEYSV
jgi:hypothetical protein